MEELLEKNITFSNKIKNVVRGAVAAAALTLGGSHSNAQEQYNPDTANNTGPVAMEPDKSEDGLGVQNLLLSPEAAYKLFVPGISSTNDKYPDTEFGFNTHIYENTNDPISEFLNLERFKKTVDELSGNGQTWVRVNIPRWEGARLDNGNINWIEDELLVFDEAFSYATDKRLKIFLVATPPSADNNMDKDQYAKITSEYFSTLAKRYGERIDVWQINNELDTHHPLDYSTVTADERDNDLVEAHIKAGSEAIRAANPRAVVTVNVTGWPLSDDMQKRWVEYIQPLTPYINAVSLDMYPDGNQFEISKLSDRVEFIRNEFKLPVYVAETGVCSIGCNLRDASQADQIIAILEDLKEAKPTAIILYQYTDESSDFVGKSQIEQIEGSFGVTTLKGEKKPGYEKVLDEMQNE